MCARKCWSFFYIKNFSNQVTVHEKMVNNHIIFVFQARIDDAFHMMMQSIIIWIPVPRHTNENNINVEQLIPRSANDEIKETNVA